MKNNKDYAEKLIPNMDKSEMFVCQYNPSDGGRPSWFTVATEKIVNGKNVGLRAVAYWKGDQADKIHDIIVNNKEI